MFGLFATELPIVSTVGFLGTPELLIIALGILLLFGAKKIPELMKGLGGGIKEFKTAMKEEGNDAKKEIDDNKEK